MQFKDLIDDVKKVKVDEVRVDSSIFFEAIVAGDQLSRLVGSLGRFFGSPAWPSEEPLSSEVQDHINSYGGIMPGQTLYSRDTGEAMVIAMLWPWRDGVHTTVKIINCQDGSGTE